MNGKLYIKKFIRDDGETLSFDAEEIYLSENNTLLVRSDPATTAVEFTEEDGGEMIRQRGATYSQPVSGLIVPKSTEYWALCVRLSRFFILNHTYKIVYIKRDGSMFSMNRAWINAGLQIVPVPYENYSTWTIEFRIGDNFWTEYAEDSQGKEIYSNSVELPLLTAGTGGEVWGDVTQQTLSGIGNYFTIDGTSISASINKLELKGDTYQQTYSGKNLIDSTSTTYVYSNSPSQVTLTAIEGGIRIMNSGGESQGRFVVFKSIDLTSYTGKVVRMKATFGTSGGIRLYRIASDGSNRTQAASTTVSGNEISFTVPEDLGNSPYLGYVLEVTVGNNTTVDFTDMIMTVDAELEPFEPYVGGIPAPNPDYPQDIQVVTGEQTVEVRGKNLIDPTNLSFIYSNSPTQIELSSISNGIRMVNRGGVSQGRFAVFRSIDLTPYIGKVVRMKATFGASGGIRLQRIAKDGSNRTVMASTAVSDTEISFTVPADLGASPYLGYVLDVTVGSGTTVDFTNLIATVDYSIEPYEPYQGQSYPISLGSLELCKIGDYQDYIYKSGDDWYLHKAMGKITLDGSETWSAAQMTNNWLYYTTNAGMAVVTSSQMPNIVSNYFSVTTTDGQWTSIAGSKSVTLNNAASPNTQIRFTVGDSTNKLADFKTWLSTHSTTVYYALATPTNILIENPGLVAQLNALAGAQAYNGKTVYQTNSATMPAILSIELLQSVGGGEIWDNVGAVWEEGVGGVQTINVETTQTTYPVWTVTGPCSNPTLQNDTTDTIASFDGMIASGQTLTVDFADNTAYLDSAPVAKYVSGYISLAPGENVIGFNSDGGSTQTSTISWDNIIN